MSTKNKTSKLPTRDEICDAALKLAVEKPWDQVSLKDLADALQIELADLRLQIDCKQDVLSIYGKRLDALMIESLQPVKKLKSSNGEVSTKDRLFDIFMERFDQLNEDRDAMLSILQSFKSDPKEALSSMPHLCTSMGWVAELADIKISGWVGTLKLLGLTGVYLKTLHVWKTDTSADLAKTMAELDKNLIRLGQAAEVLKL